MFGRNEILTVDHVKRLAAGLEGGKEMVDLVKNLVMRRASGEISQEVYESEWDKLPEGQRNWLTSDNLGLREIPPMVVVRRDVERIRRLQTRN